MWIRAQNGNFYRREAFYVIEVDSAFDAGIQHNFVKARLKPPDASSLTSGLKSIDPNAIVLGDYPSSEAARHALERLFPEYTDFVDLTDDAEVEMWR
jgi:hypothetical protein